MYKDKDDALPKEAPYITSTTFEDIFDFQSNLNKLLGEREKNPSTLSIQVSRDRINWLCNVAMEAISALGAALSSHAEDCETCKEDLKHYGL